MALVVEQHCGADGDRVLVRTVTDLGRKVRQFDVELVSVVGFGHEREATRRAFAERPQSLGFAVTVGELRVTLMRVLERGGAETAKPDSMGSYRLTGDCSPLSCMHVGARRPRSARALPDVVPTSRRRWETNQPGR
jgi:hypothetical protein